MSYAALIYLASVSGNINVFLGLIGILGLFVVIIAAICCAIGIASERDLNRIYGRKTDEPPKSFEIGPYVKWATIPLFMLFFSCIVPSERTVYTMVAAGLVQDIAENPDVQHIGDQVLELISEKLDGYLNDHEENSESENVTD